MVCFVCVVGVMKEWWVGLWGGGGGGGGGGGCIMNTFIAVILKDSFSFLSCIIVSIHFKMGDTMYNWFYDLSTSNCNYYIFMPPPPLFFKKKYCIIVSIHYFKIGDFYSPLSVILEFWVDELNFTLTWIFFLCMDNVLCAFRCIVKSFFFIWWLSN